MQYTLNPHPPARTAPRAGAIVISALPLYRDGHEIVPGQALGRVTHVEPDGRCFVSFGEWGEHPVNTGNLDVYPVPPGVDVPLGDTLPEFALRLADECLALHAVVDACEAARQTAQAKLDALVAAQMDAHRAPARLAKNGNGHQAN